MLSANYIPATTKGAKLEAVKRFMDYLVSPQGIDDMNKNVPPSGPYLVKGAELPSDVLPAVLDIASYIDAGNSAPALEFLSPSRDPDWSSSV